MSGGCEKKIIYVGKSENLLSRLIDHLFAMDTLKKNIIEEVCKKAHENIYYYMNPYLCHKDVELVPIVDVKELGPQLQGQKILTVNNVVDYIEETISKHGLKKTKNFEDNLKKSKNGDLEALERILINITQPHLNKNKKGETLKDLESHLKSYLCNYGLKIEELVNFLENLLEKEKLKSEKIKGCYIIKHSMLPGDVCKEDIKQFIKNNSELSKRVCKLYLEWKNRKKDC